MRILFTTTSGVGHLHPLVPLVRAVTELGHDVAVAAPGSLGPVLASRALPHLPLPDYGPEHHARVGRVMASLGPPGPGSELPMLREVFGWAKTDSTLAAMRDVVASWRPGLLLHEAAELSGAMAAEAARVPHATVATGLRGTLERWVPAMAEGAADLARAIGLDGDLEARRVLDVPYLSMVPASAEEPGTDVPSALRYRLTSVHTDLAPFELSGSGPLVWIALGTETWRIPGMADRLGPLLAAMAGGLPDVRFLLTTAGVDVDETAMPANVSVEAYVPQEQVLPVCDAVLGHGGFGTTMAALAQGVPLIVMPLFATDQFETASRLEEVGAATVALDPSPGHLRDAIAQVLEGASPTDAAAALAEEMANLPTPQQAMQSLLATVDVPAAR